MSANLSKAAGIQDVNCSSCQHCLFESDGDYGEYRWNECSKVPRYKYLKSFPFKKAMPCWEPNFWASKFADAIDHEEGTEYKDALRAFQDAVREAMDNNDKTHQV